MDVSYFFAEYIIKYLDDKNVKCKVSMHTLAHNINKTLSYKRTSMYKIIDYIADDIYFEITNRNISLKPIHYQEREDSSSHKMRIIGLASIKQQVYDYIAVNSCKEIFMAKIGYYQCASLKYKGQLFGKQTIERWIRTNPKNCKYVFKCDIKKCYPSISHEKLKKLLSRDLKNDTSVYILSTLIGTYEEGLCIGSYLSQYLANYYLSYAYHYISEQMYRVRRKRSGESKRVNLVSHVLFYMDDFIMFSSRKADLKKASKMLIKYIDEELGLKLKDGYQLFPLDSRGIDMMGYVIFTTHTTIRQRIFIKARKLFIKYKDERVPMSLKDARSITSYYGYIKHSDSTKFIKKYKVSRTVKRAKEVISYAEKCNIYRKTTTV